MKHLVTASLLAAATAAPATVARTVDFESAEAGELPAGFRTATTLAVEGGRWAIVESDGGKALAQLDDSGVDRRYAMAVMEEGSFKDLRLSVRGKPVAGKVDQAVGVVWRWQGPDDYYLVRSNVLERNLRLYRVVKGNRIKFAGVEGLDELRAGAWQTIKIEQHGDHIEVWLDGVKRIEARDRTIPAAGKIGVWTKADSVSWFDDLTVEGL